LYGDEVKILAVYAFRLCTLDIAFGSGLSCLINSEIFDVQDDVEFIGPVLSPDGSAPGAVEVAGPVLCGDGGATVA